jgi:hypothetical protein
MSTTTTKSSAIASGGHSVPSRLASNIQIKEGVLEITTKILVG